jgi:hypothetical protein
MASWGDLNARLNRLVRDGVISGFRTNLATRPDLSSLRITVAPGPAAPVAAGRLTAADALRARVALALGGIAPEAAVTVETTLQTGPPSDRRAQFG